MIGRCKYLAFTLGSVLLLFLPDSVSAQENIGFELPDTLRITREPFYVPSMSPSSWYTTPHSFNGDLSLADQAMMGSGEFSGAYQAAWKRSFLLGVPVSKLEMIHPSPWMAKKDAFFETFQAVLGVAEIAGAGFVAYESIKNEQSKKKR